MDLVRQTPPFMSTDNRGKISHVVSSVGKRLARFIRVRVATDEDAEDVMQEVWHQLVVSLDAGPIEQIGSWLYTVARNRIIDRYRKPRTASLDATAKQSEDDTAFDFAELLLRDDRTPRTEFLRQRFWQELHIALAELPEEQRQVFVWHELEALSFEDIAALTGEKMNTLLSRKRYAVLHLRARLQPLREEFLTPIR